LNSSLPPGTASTVQSSGESGFTVQYTRRVFRGDELLANERYTVRYDPQNAIVEVGPPKRATEKPKPEAEPKQPTTPEPPPTGEPTTAASG